MLKSRAVILKTLAQHLLNSGSASLQRLFSFHFKVSVVLKHFPSAHEHRLLFCQSREAQQSVSVTLIAV